MCLLVIYAHILSASAGCYTSALSMYGELEHRPGLRPPGQPYGAGPENRQYMITQGLYYMACY